MMIEWTGEPLFVEGRKGSFLWKDLRRGIYQPIPMIEVFLTEHADNKLQVAGFHVTDGPIPDDLTDLCRIITDYVSKSPDNAIDQVDNWEPHWERPQGG